MGGGNSSLYSGEPPQTDRLTKTTENISFPQLRWQAVITVIIPSWKWNLEEFLSRLVFLSWLFCVSLSENGLWNVQDLYSDLRGVHWSFKNFHLKSLLHLTRSCCWPLRGNNLWSLSHEQDVFTGFIWKCFFPSFCEVHFFFYHVNQTTEGRMKKMTGRESGCTIGSDPVYHNVMMELLSGLNSSHVRLLTPTTSGKKANLIWNFLHHGARVNSMMCSPVIFRAQRMRWRKQRAGPKS